MEKISVSIRVRPLDKQEAAKGSPWQVSSRTITLCGPSGAPLPNQVYTFDNVFGTKSTTAEIYSATTKAIVASAVKGFNGTIFAYGQTSSGKTYTMRGTSDEYGIIPLAIHDVFKNLEEAVDREFLLRMSYMEIYNEEINDLLAPGQKKLQVHENLERGIFVAGLREEIVASPEQVLQLMEFGEAHRHIGETNMNVYSSRSHTIFRMVIESRDRSADDSSGLSCDAVRVSVLNLVDLAGSERVAKTGAEGTRLKEGTHINKSLMTLGQVINKLSEGIENQGGHVPYRDSKLTRILQPALGGNARTAVICNITPAMIHVDETRGTLQFASRAIRVTNCAQVNEILTDAALLKRQKKEIEELRSKLRESHSEHFEEEILNLRNTLLKSENERERIALELQEEKKAHAERERQQAQKIENLSTLVLNSTIDDRDIEKRTKKIARRETWCPRIPFGNVVDEFPKDLTKPVKDDKQMLQIRERTFPLPPPFECLLEENESNGKELAQTWSVSPKKENICEKTIFVDEACAVPDHSARIHVADRKRKYCPGMATVTEVKDDFVDQTVPFPELEPNCYNAQVQHLPYGNLERTCVESVSQQEHAGIDLSSCKQDVNAMLVELDQLKIVNSSLRDSLAAAEESSKFSQQSMKETSSLLKATQCELDLLRKDYEKMCQNMINNTASSSKLGNPSDACEGEEELMKGQHMLSIDDGKSALESTIKNLIREKEELALQLTEAYIQFEEEKAGWFANAISVHSVKKETLTRQAENKECGLELEACNNNSLEFENGAAPQVNAEEQTKRSRRSMDIAALTEKLDKLNAELMEERNLRGQETARANEVERRLLLTLDTCKETADLEEKLQDVSHRLDKAIREKDEALNQVEVKSMETEVIFQQLRRSQSELDMCNEQYKKMSEDLQKLKETCSLLENNNMEARNRQEEWMSEKWQLTTESLKLQVSLDATSARSEVFHGRLLEAQDELMALQSEVDQLKAVQARKEELVAVDTSKGQSPIICERTQVHEPHRTEEQIVTHKSGNHSTAEASTRNPSFRLTDNTAEGVPIDSRIQGNKLRQQATTKRLINSRGAPDDQGEREKQGDIMSGFNTAHTISGPLTALFMKREDTEVRGARSRPFLMAIDANTTISNECMNTNKTCTLTGLNGTRRQVNQLKPPKSLLAQRVVPRPRSQPLSSLNDKENK